MYNFRNRHHRAVARVQHGGQIGGQQGQATIAMVGVIAITLVLVAAFAVYGQALVHRARARTAADAIALATASDPDAAAGLTRWYTSQGVVVDHQNGRTWAASGPSQAAAWAEITAGEVETAPVLRAIVARVEQLRGQQFVAISWQRSSFELAHDEAQIMQSMAPEFALCSWATTRGLRFEPC